MSCTTEDLKNWLVIHKYSAVNANVFIRGTNKFIIGHGNRIIIIQYDANGKEIRKIKTSINKSAKYVNHDCAAEKV